MGTKTTKWKRPKWSKVLDKWLWDHLCDTCKGKPTLRAVKSNIDHQAKHGIICLDCNVIASKLGLK